MGCLEAFCRKENIHLVDEKLKEGTVDFNEIPDDQYLCPKCEENPSIPLILKKYSGFGEIEIKCQNHREFLYPINKFLKESGQKSYFDYECSGKDHGVRQKNNKENIYQYCKFCNKAFCEKCKDENKRGQNKIEGHENGHEEFCIPANAKYNCCLEHPNSQIISYCEDCHENVCERESNEKHKKHKIISLHDLKGNINHYIEIIKNKNKTLGDIINFNKIIIKSYQHFQDNYYCIQNLINVGNQINFDYESFLYLRCMLDKITKINIEKEKILKEQEKILKELKDKYDLEINGNEKELIIKKNKKLNEKGLELISKIQFKNLEKLTISECSIKNISPLKNMNFSKLRKMDLSVNEIENINIFEDLEYPHLTEIDLNQNKINDFEPLMDKNKFPILGNLIIENNQEIEKWKERYFKLYKEELAKTPEDFKKKYGVEIKEDLDLSNKKLVDTILEELNYIVKSGIKIKKLNLRNNDIKYCSLLSKINLINLEELDLSFNKIENLNFLSHMEIPNLEAIVLDNNSLNDISPLKKIKKINKLSEGEKKLKKISLKNNNKINYEDEKTKCVIKLLESKKIETGLNLPEDY